MNKLLGYGAGLVVLKNAVPQELVDEIEGILSTTVSIGKSTNAGIKQIEKEISGMSRISFNIGAGKISLFDLINYFSIKVSNLWNSGETLKVIIGMALLVVGVLSLVVAPIVTLVKYLIGGIKNKSEFNFKLRNLFMALGIEATIGAIFVLYFARLLN